MQKIPSRRLSAMTVPTAKNVLLSLLILLCSTLLGQLFYSLKFTGANTITVYILGALLTALFTKNYICAAGFSLASVLLFSFLFTEPVYTFKAYDSGFPVTFAIMLVASLITGTLAIQNLRNAKEKEQNALLAKNEQLRANLLRSISHDLRTPLTAISGNSENLIANFDKIDADTRKQILTDINEDSRWLIALVENLLSISRISEGRMSINMSAQLAYEVITEALQHIGRNSDTHIIKTELGDGLLLADMDARLISQVIVNLVDNALKYTEKGTEITVSAVDVGNSIKFSVTDTGKGIPDSQKEAVFKMFYTGENRVADCRRSMGLGLSLCDSIISAHGGKLILEDNKPQGCVFSFMLNKSEVNLNG